MVVAFLIHLMNVAIMLGSNDLLFMSAALLLFYTRFTVVSQTIFTGIKTRLTNMHLFYGGIILFLLSVTVASFISGVIFYTTIFNLFSSSATLTGGQILQAFLFVLGIFFIVIDFPHKGHNSPKF